MRTPALFATTKQGLPLGITMSRLIWCTYFWWFLTWDFSSCQQTQGSSSFKSCLHLAPAFWACALHSCAASAGAAHTLIHSSWQCWHDNRLAIGKIWCPLIAAGLSKSPLFVCKSPSPHTVVSRGSYLQLLVSQTVHESACRRTQ